MAVPDATTAGPSEQEQPTALKKWVKALEEERIALRTRMQQFRLEATASLGSLQEQLDAATADRQSPNDRLTEKKEIIAELEATIHALRASSADLEQQQQIKTLNAQPSAEGKRPTEPEPLQLPSRAMSHGWQPATTILGTASRVRVRIRFRPISAPNPTYIHSGRPPSVLFAPFPAIH